MFKNILLVKIFIYALFKKIMDNEFGGKFANFGISNNKF